MEGGFSQKHKGTQARPSTFKGSHDRRFATVFCHCDLPKDLIRGAFRLLPGKASLSRKAHQSGHMLAEYAVSLRSNLTDCPLPLQVPKSDLVTQGRGEQWASTGDVPSQLALRP